MPSDRKRSKGRSKKRKFCGNQFLQAKKARLVDTVENLSDEEVAEVENSTASDDDSLLVENESTTPTCRSELKIKSAENFSDSESTQNSDDSDEDDFVLDSKPYGEEKLVEKIECVGHIQKRMGNRLRALKKSLKGQVLADGKPIGGQRRLTDAVCDKLQTYYGNAIRGNKGDLVEMRKAVWAVYFHKGSTDANPTHNFCSVEWCPYLQAERDGRLDTFTHKGNLPPAIMEAIKPIFKDLAKTELLRKCLQGYTQNANESLNSTIWRYCPKTKNHGSRTVKTALAIAVTVFNDGATSFGAMLEEMDIRPGVFATAFFARRDTVRISNAQRQAKSASLEERRARRQERLTHNDNCAAREGHPYLAGGH